MVTVVCPAAASVPLLAEALSQAEVLMTDQLNDEALELVSVKTWDEGENGPPDKPLLTNPDDGVIPKASVGPAKALIRFCPFGVPQPVQRSYPATA